MKFLKKFTGFVLEKSDPEQINYHVYYGILLPDENYLRGSLQIYPIKNRKYPEVYEGTKISPELERASYLSACEEIITEDRVKSECWKYISKTHIPSKLFNLCREKIYTEMENAIVDCVDRKMEKEINDYRQLPLFNKVFLVIVSDESQLVRTWNILFEGHLNTLRGKVKEYESTGGVNEADLFIELFEGEDDEDVDWREVAQKTLPVLKSVDRFNLYSEIKSSIPELWSELRSLGGEDLDTSAQAGDWGF